MTSEVNIKLNITQALNDILMRRENYNKKWLT